MKGIFRYSSSLFLWLAGLALVAHLIIPHDHHTIDSFASEDKTCPVENNHHGDNHRGSPIHCHAFNDLAAEKAVKYNLVEKQKNLRTYYFLPPDIITDPDNNDFVVIRYNKVPLSGHFIARLSRLRAPPALA